MIDTIFKGYMCLMGARYCVPFDVMNDWFEASSVASNHYITKFLRRVS